MTTLTISEQVVQLLLVFRLSLAATVFTSTSKTLQYTIPLLTDTHTQGHTAHANDATGQELTECSE